MPSDRITCVLPLLISIIGYFSDEGEGAHYVGRTYILHPDKLDWSTANQRCSSTSGVLATIHDISTVPDLTYSIPDIDGYGLLWVGLQRVNSSWRWSSGAEVTWTNWENGTSMADNCTALKGGYPAEWTTVSCGDQLSFLCEHAFGECYFKEKKKAMMIVHVDLHMSESTLEDCFRVCDDANELACSSVEYHAPLQHCQLSKANLWTHYEYYRRHYRWDLYHRVCNLGSMYNPNDTYSTTSGPEVTSLTTSASTTTSPGPVGAAPVPRKYTLYEEELTWFEARALCRSDGGKLARIYGLSTMPELGLHFHNITETSAWIGIHRRRGSEWEWADDVSAVDWTNWKYAPVYSDCAVVELQATFKWVPKMCYDKHYFLCEQTADNCTWTEWQSASIIANNREVFYNLTSEECMNACSSGAFPWCRSVDHHHDTGTCNLCDGNRWTLPEFFKDGDPGWNYYHLQCNFGVVKNRLLETTTETTVKTSTVFTTEVATTTTTSPTTTTTTEAPTTTTVVTTTTVRETTLTVCTVKAVTPRIIPTLAPEVIQELQQFETVAKEKKKKRAKTSVLDDRPVSKSVGTVAIAIICSMVLFIFILDLRTFYIHCGYMKRNVKQNRWRKRKQKLVSPILTFDPDEPEPEPQPLPEAETNVNIRILSENDILSRAKLMAKSQEPTHANTEARDNIGTRNRLDPADVEIHMTRDYISHHL